ncbi:MAG TPA: diguanylate cyclase [Solirubrobacteraceae bacterium]|nr:diguanylate cyclase [Solirubrobacteraceae bacterium]
MAAVSRTSRLRAYARGLRDRVASRLGFVDAHFSDILDLFEEQVYAGVVTADGHFVANSPAPIGVAFLGGPPPDGMPPGEFWESRIHPDDWETYTAFNHALLRGEDADAKYRVLALDGVTRVIQDRARPIRRADGSVLIRGIISDVTRREEAVMRLAQASDRFTRLLDVVGEHVYLAQTLPDGGIKELFQGPGADRLLGGAEPDPEMKNWEAALHPADRPAYDAFNEALAAGKEADVEYRLIGADGVTRWVHDRAAIRPLPDGTVEISGIVSDVSERRRMRAELAEAHAALSRVVDAMDDHLYTLRVESDRGYVTVYRGPHRDALAGGAIPDGTAGDRLWESLVHPDDHELWRSAVARLVHAEPIELEYRLVGLDGAVRVLLDRLRPRREADGTLYYDGATRDITERRRLEDELRLARTAAERRARTDELTGVFNRRHFAEIVADTLAGEAAGSGLLLLDADHFKQVNDVYGHVVGDAVLVELARRLQTELGPEDCLARWGGEEFAVLLRGVASDAELDGRAQALRAAVEREPVVAAGASVRLTISVGATRSGGELSTLDALVEAADRCLYTAKRAGRNRVSLLAGAGAVAEVPEDLVEPEAVAVARALALVSGGSLELHAEAVADIAGQVAARLGLPDTLVLRCRLGGWLHDVGKATIPERILAKPGPLDEAEWAVMRTHPVIGEEIVLGAGAVRDAAAAVRHHHERYDGTGYPDRLAGDAIPIEARIVAAADAYAAMTADRPYSAARTPQEAMAELRRCSGSQLDPRVVAALLAVLGPSVRPALRVA